MGLITQEINLDNSNEIDKEEVNESENIGIVEETSASDGVDIDDTKSSYRYDESTSIKEIEVKNFKCIGDIKLTFDESPIISLTGNSDVGKTSIIHGLAVLIYNAYSQHQKRWIKTGKAGFGVRMELNDGTIITRIKSAKGDMYHLSDSTGEYHFDKLDTVASVPTVIKDKLGCMIEKETREFVNIRTYKEQMLFVTTPASTTYKVIYSALNVDYITKSVKRASLELNELRDKDRRNKILIDDTLSKLKTVKVVDTEVLGKVKERLANRVERIKVLKNAVEILREYKKLEDKVQSYDGIENIGEIDTDRIESLRKALIDTQGIKEYEKVIDKYSEIQEVQDINIERFKRLSNCYANVKETNENIATVGKYSDIEAVQDFGRAIENIAKIQKTIRDNAEVNSMYNNISRYDGLDEIKEIRKDANEGIRSTIELIKDAKEKAVEFNKKLAEYKKLEKELEESGVKVAVCPKCGTDIYM